MIDNFGDLISGVMAAVPRRRGRPAAATSILPVGQQTVPVNQLRDLHLTLKQLHLNVTSDEDTCLSWLAEHGLVANEKTCSDAACPTQNAAMVLNNRDGTIDNKSV